MSMVAAQPRDSMTQPPMGADERDRRVAIGLFGAVAALLALVIPFEPHWYDAGELLAAMFTAGVPHPTGFPALVPLGKGATLLPVGSVALRVNLLMAMCGAATVALLFLALRRATANEARPQLRTAGPAVLGALGLLLAFPFWLHATVVEVYVPNLCLLAAYLAVAMPLLAAPADRPLPARRVLMLAFLMGVGLGAHITFPLVAGALTLPLVVRVLGHGHLRRQALRLLPAALLLVFFGALVLAFLPLAASREPFQNWGDPSSWSRLLDHLTGARIRRMFATEIGGWSATALAADATRYGRLVLDALGPLLLAALLGVVWLARRARLVCVATSLALAADAFFTIKINPMGMPELQTSLPSFLILNLWAGVGIVVAGRALASAFPARPRLAASFVALPVLGLWAPVGLHAPDARALYRTTAAALARGAMDRAAPGALWLTSSDHLCALSGYLQAVENHRPDLGWVIKPQLWDPVYLPALAAPARGSVVPASVVERQAAAERADQLGSFATQAGLLQDIVAAYERDGRPVYVELGDAALDAPFYDRLQPEFPLWRVAPTASPLGDLASFDGATAEGIRAWAGRSDGLGQEPARKMLGHWLRIAASVVLQRGDDTAGAVLLSRAAELMPDDARVLNNLAVLQSRRGDLAGATESAAKAVVAEPDYRKGWVNLGGFRAVAMDEPGTYEAFARAATLGPTPRDELRMAFELGRLHARRGTLTLARLWLDRALAIDPNHAQARMIRDALP